MSVASSINRFVYTANGVLTAFAMTNCLVYASSHVQVYLNGVLTATGYTVSGVGDPAGATVTFDVAPANGVKIVLLRVVPNTQLTSYKIAGAFPAKTTERDLDLATMQSQQAHEALNRSPKLPITSTLVDLPFPEPGAGQFIRYNASGTALEAVDAPTQGGTPLAVLSGFTKAGLPSAGNAGRLARVTNDVQGVWMDQGSQWFALTGEVINVKEFGAKGNDSADDWAAIQAILDLTPLGKTIYFPPGIYRITSTLTVKSYTRLVGAGSGGNTSGIFTSNNASAIRYVGTIGAVNFQDQTTDSDKIVMQSGLEDIAIIGNGLTSGYGVKIQNPALVDLNRVFIANHGGVGVDVVGGEFSSTWGQSTFIRNSWLTHNFVGDIRVRGAYRPTLTVIENNTILAGGKYLIYIENGWITNIVKNELASLSFNGMGTGVQGHGVVINDATIVNIDSNSFESMSGQVGTPVKAIYTGFNGDTQTNTSAAVQGLNVTHNSFNPGLPNYDGIHARMVRGLTVEGNFVQNGVAGGTNRFLVLENMEAPWPVHDIHKNHFFNTTNITPVVALTPYTARRLATPTYGASILIDSNTGNNTGGQRDFKITATNGNVFTIENPSGGFGYGDVIEITVKNTSGGALGVITWGTLYKLAAWTSPATGFNRSIRFRFDPDGNWYEVSRTAVDVPN
jgi:pectate lyase-like protein